MANEFIKQRITADRETLAQNINAMQSELADLETHANRLRNNITQQSGALQYADLMLQQIEAQEQSEAKQQKAQREEREELAKAVAENMAETAAELATLPDYGAPQEAEETEAPDPSWEREPQE